MSKRVSYFWRIDFSLLSALYQRSSISRVAGQSGSVSGSKMFTEPGTVDSPSQNRFKRWLDANEFEKWSQTQNWLLMEDTSKVGQSLRVWMKGMGWKSKTIAELDSFDGIVNLVALGMGVGFVPVRALSPFRRRNSIKRIDLLKSFQRELQVISRRMRNRPAHLSHFIEDILF